MRGIGLFPPWWSGRGAVLSEALPLDFSTRPFPFDSLHARWLALRQGKPHPPQTTESSALTLAHRLLIESINAPYRRMSLEEMDRLAAHFLAETPDVKEGEEALPPEALEELQNRQLAVITGFGNPDTSLAFGNVLAKAWGRKVGIIGIGNGGFDFKPNGLYITSGVSHAAWAPDWKAEMPPLVLRLRNFIALDPEAPLDLAGYSQGGYQVYALARFREIFWEKGTLTREDVSHFPGLGTPAMLDHLCYLIEHYAKHKGLAMGFATPVGGVHPQIYKTPFGQATGLATRHAIDALSQDAIRATYIALGGRRFEEVMDGCVFGLLSQKKGDTPWRNPGADHITRMGHVLLATPRWIELFISKRVPVDGDGIGDYGNMDPDFRTSAGVRFLDGYDHITLFFSPEPAAVFAKRSARILHHRKTSGHARRPGLSPRDSRTSAIVGSAGLARGPILETLATEVL